MKATREFRLHWAILLPATLVLGSRLALATQAQPVPIPEDPSTAPQIDIAGVGIATGTFGRTGGQKKLDPGINIQDSALQVGAAQRLYEGGIGSFGLGGVTTEDANREVGTSVFLHQAFLDFQSESFEALVGRASNPTAHLVDFPTLREEDLLTLTNPMNPFSKGGSDEEHRYSNSASLTWNQGLKFFENIHAQHLINTSGAGSDSGINSFGFTFQTLGTPGMEAFEHIPSWGVGFEHLTLDASSPGGLHQIYAGGVLNLNESVTHRWDFRVQDILSLGSALETLTDEADAFRANSNSVSASLRYLISPFGRPGYQFSLTGGFKNYLRVKNANSLGWALTTVKRLGQGFDLAAQYKGQWREPSLSQVQASGLSVEHVAELGFVFNFDATFNEHIRPRRTLLNQQHQYIPN